MLDWLFGPGKKKKARPWTVIYSEDGGYSPLSNPRNIPRWLRKRVLGLERLPLDRYYVFKGKRYEYRVSFTTNHGHGRVVVRASRR